MASNAKSSSKSSATAGTSKAGNLVIVESPAKAETIHKYLGSDYKVMASYGHIRDLPAKNGSVDPDNQFQMIWEVDARAKKRIDEITKAAKQAQNLILATDPDREGEAISWHVYQVLKEAKAVDENHVQRVVFNEITKTAIQKAIKNPREINQPLVDAYMARRALDYLVGFTLSPVLWRKLPGSRSAGRVQSVALRLICERESEIEDFKPQEYWSVEATMLTEQAQKFTANVVGFEGTKLGRLDIPNKKVADNIVSAIEQSQFHVQKIDNKTVRRNPYPPFITSTLQQEASRKLGFSVSRTMQTAQRLYEGINLGGETVGLITYMRTDGVNLAEEAVANVRGYIQSQYGDKYLPGSPRMYKSKSKNAQEAHEAIRPTDINRHPDKVKQYLNEDQYRLYELIWRRTLACQMENAVLDQVSVDILGSKQQVTLRATGSVMVFDGFYAVYQEDRDDKPEAHTAAAEGDDDTSDRRLPKLTEQQKLDQKGIESDQHFTKPPPRYTEASLVKKMEELGIGRPSTYASIIHILQERKYVRMESKRFIPEDRGRLVTSFLSHFFNQYVQYHFTAELEDKLDEVSDNKRSSSQVLTEFWTSFYKAIEGTKDLKISDVIDTLDEELGSHFFPVAEEGKDPRECTSCKTGRLGLRLGRFGAFIACSNYPECKYTRQLKVGEEGEGAGAEMMESSVELGDDPATGKKITLNKGPYGHYVQLGEEEEVEVPVKGKKVAEKKTKIQKIKPKRASLPKDLLPADCTLEKAISLLTLPREIGAHPETGELISAGLGRFGPYLKMGTTFFSVKNDDILTIPLDRAVEVIDGSGKKSIPLGTYKNKPVAIQKGRWGYFIAYNKKNISIPKKIEHDKITIEQAIELIEAKLVKAK